MNDSSQRSLHQLSAWEIHKSFLDGTLSAIEITKYFLHRITSFDDKTQAFLSVFSNEAIEQAEILDKILQPLHSALFIESNPSPVKYAASLLGMCSPKVRLPLVEIREETKKKVSEALKVAKLL